MNPQYEIYANISYFRMLIEDYMKEAIPNKDEVMNHVKRFELMVELCRANGIKKFSYGDLGDSRLKCAVISILRQRYDIDYTTDDIYYISDNVVLYLLKECFYDSDLVDQIDEDDAVILQMYKASSVKYPKWWLPKSPQ